MSRLTSPKGPAPRIPEGLHHLLPRQRLLVQWESRAQQHPGMVAAMQASLEYEPRTYYPVRVIQSQRMSKEEGGVEPVSPEADAATSNEATQQGACTQPSTFLMGCPWLVLTCPGSARRPCCPARASLESSRPVNHTGQYRHGHKGLVASGMLAGGTWGMSWYA